MKSKFNEVIGEISWYCYVTGAHLILWFPIVLFGIVAAITPLAWLGALDWPVWLKVLMTPVSAISLYIANDLLNDCPRQVDNIYRRWNDEPLRPTPKQTRPHHDSPRRHQQPRHVKIVERSKEEKS